MKQKNIIPLPVLQAMNYSILSTIFEKNAFDYEIVGMEAIGLEVKYIKTITDNRRPAAYKVFFRKKNTINARIMEKNITIISTSVVLLHEMATAEDIKTFATLQELEDELSKRAEQRDDGEFVLLVQQPIDDAIISRVQKQLALIVGKHIDLIEVFKRFKNVRNFNNLLKEIIEACHFSNPKINEGIAKGKLYELSCAYKLAEKETIVAFSSDYSMSNAKAEFDIETESGKLIECKYTENKINLGRIVEQANIANYNHKKFELYIHDKISDDLQKQLVKHQITYKDNFN